MIIGGTWMLATLLGLLNFDSLALLVAVTAVIGGIVLLGSTTAAAKQTSTAMKEAEAVRNQLISKIELQVVEDSLSRKC
jgi:hypothetical protein